ncbi:hypothetical protein SELMODRAFT_406696 [Selaginella moellendorffii]|uniref:Mitochondrial import inner membrane translocase subunit TIM50 n=1 Tax=Selaginella moellendorffii TaxID=88036 RepID=D8R159_SELML|nr:hypothetical protein SELMODRAFT_406696 [Selaginella moellendorffii]
MGDQRTVSMGGPESEELRNALPCVLAKLELSNHKQRQWLLENSAIIDYSGWLRELLECKTYGMVVEHLCARNTLLPPQDAVLEGRMTVALDLDNTLISPSSILWRSQCDFEPPTQLALSSSWIHVLGLSDCTLWHDTRLGKEALFKDLAILGRDLRKVVLVDNDPGFFCQPGSGNEIVIGKFTGQRSDDGLLKLLPVLQSLAQLDDVRPAVRTYQQPQAQGGNQTRKREWVAPMESPLEWVAPGALSLICDEEAHKMSISLSHLRPSEGLVYMSMRMLRVISDGSKP